MAETSRTAAAPDRGARIGAPDPAGDPPRVMPRLDEIVFARTVITAREPKESGARSAHLTLAA